MKKIDMAVNINPFGIPKKSFNILKKSINSLKEYPDQENESVIKELSKFTGLRTKNIISGNGSTELFFLLPKVLDIKKSLIVGPTFWEYEYTNKINGEKSDYFMTSEKDGFVIDFNKLKNVLGKYKFLYLCNTNNPTSVNYDRRKILKLVKKFKKTVFIVDETYLLFDEKYFSKSLNREVKKFKNLIVISSLSKMFSLPGLRMGFGVADKKIIDKLKGVQIPFKKCLLVQKIIGSLLEDVKYQKKTRRFIKLEGKRLYAKYKKLKILKPFKPEANFLLCKIMSDKFSAEWLVKKVNRNGFLVRDCSSFKGLGKKWIRFNIGKRGDNNLLYKNFKKIENEL